MRRIVFVFAPGLLLPLVVVLATFGFFVQRFKQELELAPDQPSFIAMPYWPYWALPILGVIFLMFQLRPPPLKSLAMVIAYVLVFYSSVFIGESAIMRCFGIFID